MTEPSLLIVAKAPVPGECKTRIAAEVGDENAAALAAAALLDTLETAMLTGSPVVVATSGDLDQGVQSEQTRAAMSRMRVIEQRGVSFAERLANAHHDADTGAGIVQVGMDTPHMTIEDVQQAGALVQAGETVLGPAEDGGWWLLGEPDATQAQILQDVPMSSPQTCAHTAEALGRVRWLRTLRDMDTWADAVTLAEQFPTSRLAKVHDTVSGIIHD